MQGRDLGLVASGSLNWHADSCSLALVHTVNGMIEPGSWLQMVVRKVNQ